MTPQSLSFAFSLLLALGCPSIAAQDGPDKTQPATQAAPKPKLPLDITTLRGTDDLIAVLRALEKDFRQVSMRIETTGVLPDGAKFRTEGSQRVLGATHFHVTTRWDFGEGLEGETETVRTPDGVWMRERDPAQGTVFTRMDRSLMVRVDSANRALGGGMAAGPGAETAESPLGSRMIADLRAGFELTLRGPQEYDGSPVIVVAGPRRAGVEDEMLAPEADFVEMFVRSRDGAVVRMAQLRQGVPLSEIRIVEFDQTRELSADSFTLVPPKDVSFRDVMDHPPAREQILRLFQDATERGWKDPAATEAPEPVKRGEEGSSEKR
ncbi:MAG: hypothetical protein AB7I19_08000 [Planctomycetota bacterium]